MSLVKERLPVAKCQPWPKYAVTGSCYTNCSKTHCYYVTEDSERPISP